MQKKTWYSIPTTRKNPTKNSNLGDDSYNEVLITQILLQMPSIYENKIDHIKHKIDIRTKMSIVEVLGHLRDKYISLKKEKSFDSRASHNTTAIFAKQFKGYCRECGEYGHKKADYPKLKRNNKN